MASSYARGVRAPEPSPEQSGDGLPTATRILDAAEALFAQRGFSGVSVREIAAAVDLNQASLYNHFKNKEALYEAVLERGFKPIFELMQQGGVSLRDQEFADKFIESLIHQLWTTPHLPKLLQREILNDGEVFRRVSEKWLRPLYEQADRTLGELGVSKAWEEDEIPFFIVAMYHILFGHFLSAALIRQVVEFDPLSPDVRDRYIKFVHRAVDRLMDRPRPVDG